MKRLLAGLVGVGLLAASCPAAEKNPEDAKLEAFFREYLNKEFTHRPSWATELGDHRFDHLLDDVSAEARKKWRQRLQETLRQLKTKIDYKKLSRASQIDYEIFRHDLERSLWLSENFNPFERDPRTYNTYITGSVYLLLTQSTRPKEENIKNCIARIKQIPKVIAAARANLKNPPKVFVETARRQNRGAIAFYERGLFDLAGDTRQQKELRRAAAALVPVLKDYQAFLQDDLLPRANGEWRIGKERFAQKLELELDAGIGADEVLREAESEAKRVVAEMYVIARQLWSQAYPKKPLPPDDEEGRRRTIELVLAHYNREHTKVEELVHQARADVAKLKKFIEDHDILRLPKPDRCQIIEMPEFQRGNSTAFLNPAPPLDEQAVSIYAISPPPADWSAERVNTYLEEYNRYMLQILSIHEAYPGHYVQLEYSNRHPSLIRRVLSSGVFAEGWAVYTEQMMLDQGYGDGSLPLRLNQLKWYLRTVANAILDHKMHCTKMSDQEAFDLLTKGAFQSEGEALGKIIRSKQSSCQLSTYFVGRTAFYRLRHRIQRELGDEFDLGRFHEAVLAHGTLPVKYLPEVTRQRLKQPR
ncbi:MAG: hypothetical protein KatS3mg105_2738 [Gemmatales bacterium]|nr:MAG: hypothetical protein KatS3mg105_2738 [Gemmatales bacterium]